VYIFLNIIIIIIIIISHKLVFNKAVTTPHTCNTEGEGQSVYHLLPNRTAT